MADARYGTSRTSVEMGNQAPLDHEISSCSDVCLKNKCLDKPDDVPIDPKNHRGTAESLVCSPAVGDDEGPLNPAVLFSTDLCKDIVTPMEQVMKEKIEQNLAENIDRTVSYKAEPVDRNAGLIPVENTVSSQEISSADFVCDKGSSDRIIEDRTSENNELKEQNSEKPNACLEKDVAKVHGKPLNFLVQLVSWRYLQLDQKSKDKNYTVPLIFLSWAFLSVCLSRGNHPMSSWRPNQCSRCHNQGALLVPCLCRWHLSQGLRPYRLQHLEPQLPPCPTAQHLQALHKCINQINHQVQAQLCALQPQQLLHRQPSPMHSHLRETADLFLGHLWNKMCRKAAALESMLLSFK